MALFQAEEQGNGIMSINNKDNDVVMQIMSCVGLALSLPYPSGISLPNTYYFPSVQSSKVKMSCTPQAVQLVLSTKSPRINMQIDVTKQLLSDMQKSSLSLDPIEYVNSITITTEGEILAGIELTFQGDVTEITLKNIERIPDNQLEHLCLKIAKALQGMFKEKLSSLMVYAITTLYDVNKTNLAKQWLSTPTESDIFYPTILSVMTVKETILIGEL